ncbi:MAG TPA: prepilin-type N-terminal cleavage/methylation domain-containing protein [Acidimicrobiia bacterium]|nr:prepilin-type N-terminal cleavage/methylation domain-containing protein [Acidimicrobiia bacterium]
MLRRARAIVRARRRDEQGFTIVEVTIATSIMVVVLAMFFGTLASLSTSEDRAQRLVSNEQNVRFELDQLARDIRAANPLVPLLNAATAAGYDNQIEVVLGPTGGSQQVIRWTYDTTTKQMVRQLMSSTASNATNLSQTFLLVRVRNIETATPVFQYFGQQDEDLVAQTLANSGNLHDPANCAVRVHIVLRSDSNPGPVPFTETQDVEIRNRLPGNVGCG